MRVAWFFLLLAAGILCLVLSVRGWRSGDMALLGGACLLRAGWELGRRNRDLMESHSER